MYRKFVLLTLFFLVVTFALGVYVRATGAGTACPDAPACFGQWWPPENLPAEALQRYPGVFYDAAAARLHMLHRLAAGAAGVLLLGLLATAVRQPRRIALIGSWSLALLYGLQAGLGTALVASRMMPALVAFHWLTGVVMILAAFGWYLRLAPSPWESYSHTQGLRRLALTALGVALLQGWLGALVGANYADLVCPDFPTCQGRWWPESLDWHVLAFWEQWRYGLSGWSLPDADGRITLHWLHRLGALVGFVVLFLLGLSISSNPKVPHLGKVGVLLNFLLLVVIAFGMSVVIKGAPAYLVVGHSLAALAILFTNYGIVFFLRCGPPLPQARAAEAAGEAPPPPEVPIPPPAEVPPAPETLFERLKSGLGKTRQGLTGFLASLPLTGRELDEALLEEIETHLLMADVGVEATEEIIDRLKARLSRQQLKDQETVMQVLHDVLLEILEPCSRPLRIDPAHKPFVILVVGVNGVGKTTTIGKLAKRLQRQGHSVMLAAGDTFRAAAVEQLKVWGERNQVPVVAQHTGADSASVIYDALQAAKARGIDVLIADTAGRLHTKSNLMEELAKIKRIMAKLDPTAPHEVLLVLDATTGQNAISQAEQFNQAVGVTGIALTKLDGTAKGGVIFALAKRFGIPIRFIGIGEGIDDLQDFDAKAFVDALFAEQPREAPAPVLH